MSNFNLKKFLTENKLTGNSILLQEEDTTQPIPNDIIWTDEDEDTASQGTFNQFDQSAEDLEGYEVEVLGYSPSTGKAYVGSTYGSYGETEFDDIQDLRQMSSSETKHYMEALEKYEPEHFKKMSQLHTEKLNEKSSTFFKATVTFSDKPGIQYGYTVNGSNEEEARQELTAKLSQEEPGREYEIVKIGNANQPKAPAGALADVDYDSIEIDGIDTDDYPDFVDAYIAAANFEDGTPLTDEELDQLNDEMAGEIHDLAYQSLFEGKTKREQELLKEVFKTLK